MMKLIFTTIFPWLLCFIGVDLNQDVIVETRKTTKGQPEWVREIMDRKPTMTKITRCIYDNEVVWKVNACVTCNDMITYVYDRDKNVICEYGGVLRENTCKDNDIVLEDCRIIYKPKFKMSF